MAKGRLDGLIGTDSTYVLKIETVSEMSAYQSGKIKGLENK